MDPLSITASIAGLLTLSGNIYTILSGLISKVEDAPRSARSAAAAVEEMKVILSSVQKVIGVHSSIPYERRDLIQVDYLIITLTQSVITLSEFESHIKPFAAASEIGLVGWNRLKWSWDESKVSSYVQRLESHKISLTVMLNILQCQSDQEAQSSREKLQSMMERIMDQNQDMLARLRRHSFDSKLPATSILEDSNSTIRAPSQRIPPTQEVSDESRIDHIMSWSFEGALRESRIYRRTGLYDIDGSLRTSIARTHAWSIFSGLSLAEISDLSVIALPLYYSDLPDGSSIYISKHQEQNDGVQKVPQSSVSEISKHQFQNHSQTRSILPNYNGERRFSLMQVMQIRKVETLHNELIPTRWTEAEIQATVTRQFILSKLKPDGQARLNQPLKFGNGLSDDVYMDWIDLKAKRLFLILADLGIPSCIFSLVDNSWDDSHLPISFVELGRFPFTKILGTYTAESEMKLNFFYRQHVYLAAWIQKGDHLCFEKQEVPLHLVKQINSDLSVVYLGGGLDDLFTRQKKSFKEGFGCMARESFLSLVNEIKTIDHDHIQTLWASYAHQSCGYLLLKPAIDCTLRNVLSTPGWASALAEQDKYILLLNWINHLASALTHLHSRGLSHRKICPSTILIDQENHVFLGDIQYNSEENADKESWDYQAPEFHRNSIIISNTETPQQESDIFSLGTIFLEILTFVMKRDSEDFAFFRSGQVWMADDGTPVDYSFHKNLHRVSYWVSDLTEEAAKMEDDIYRHVERILSLVRLMLSRNPAARPNAKEVHTILMIADEGSSRVSSKSAVL